LPTQGPTDLIGNTELFEVRSASGDPVSFSDLPLVRALTRGETVVGHELQIRAADGRMVPMLVNASPLELDGDGPSGAVAVLQDVSLLRDLERMREEWTSIVAHDLRQPVAVILLATSILETIETDDEGIKKTIARVSRAGNELERMIADLLDVSRIESRRLTIAAEPLALDDALREIAEQSSPMCRGLRVVVNVEPDLPKVEADAGRLHQIVTNLLTNAAKYGDGSSDIRLEAARAGDRVEISITNRGRGLAKDELERVFDRYYRTPGTAKTREGLGLGLFIVKGLVEAHGGRITAQSEPGGTTTFRFTLRAAAATRAAIAKPAAA
jgi:signal transduction histidine kinase